MSAVGLPARLAARLARGRRMAEARMGAVNGGSDAVVRRDVGLGPLDPVTGRQPRLYDVVHTGRCRVRGASRGATTSRTLTLPGGELESGAPEIHFPVTVTTIRDGDLIEITAGERAGSVWRVKNFDLADQQTALRLPVESTQRPEEWAA